MTFVQSNTTLWYMLIKVCGMRDAHNISEVDSIGVEMIGFIKYPKSSRYVGKDFMVPSSTKALKVGVFVNATQEEIDSSIAKDEFDVYQLHGTESPEQCQRLREEGKQVIKALSVSNDLPDYEKYEGVVDYLLFDTKTTKHGGSGLKFDWSCIKEYQGQSPIILSGGITKTDAREIMRLSESNTAVVGVDLNSRFELSPALKNTDDIRQFKTELHEN